MNNKELNDIEHRTTFYESMYEYAKDANISHYKWTVWGDAPRVIALEFNPVDDADVTTDYGAPIYYDDKTYIPINWGEKEESAILKTAIEDDCWIRYIPGNRKGTYVSDGTVYKTETAAMRGR